MNAWTRYQEDEHVKVGWRTIVKKSLELPDGNKLVFDTISQIGAKTAAIIALTPDNEVVIAKQFRVGPERYMMELPGGMVDAGEDSMDSAKRELKEETGYVSDDVTFLGTAYEDAYSNVERHYFLARNCQKTSAPELELGELIDVELISIEQLIYNAKHAAMTDSIAVLQAYDLLQDISKGGN
jgi:ADP-ribose pyrophosphatase